jgi:hypothetical protein
MKAFRLLGKITQLKAARKSEVQITKPGVYCMYNMGYVPNIFTAVHIVKSKK